MGKVIGYFWNVSDSRDKTIGENDLWLPIRQYWNTKKHLCSIICRNIEDFISKLQIMEHP